MMLEAVSAEGPQIELRAVVADDEPFLFTVYASSREFEMAQVPWDEAQKEAFLTMQFAAQQSHYQSRYPQATHQIILAGDAPVGRLYVDRGEQAIRIMDVTILPAHRRQGIGTRIVRDLIAEAERAAKSLTIWVESFNPSRTLFERLGFSPIEEDGVNILFERPSTAR